VIAEHPYNGIPILPLLGVSGLAFCDVISECLAAFS
jgi:hypothetical protein